MLQRATRWHVPASRTKAAYESRVCGINELGSCIDGVSEWKISYNGAELRASILQNYAARVNRVSAFSRAKASRHSRLSADRAQSPLGFAVRRVASNCFPEGVRRRGSVALHEKDVAAEDVHARRPREELLVELEQRERVVCLLRLTDSE